MKSYIDTLVKPTRQALLKMNRVLLLVMAALVGAGPILLLNMTATADQISNRSLAILSARAGATTTYTLSFTPANTTHIQSIKF